MIKIFNALKRIQIIFRNIKHFVYSLSEDRSVQDTLPIPRSDNEIFAVDELGSILQLSDNIEEDIDMQPIKEFFDSYLGLIALDFISYAEDVNDVRSQICMRMLVNVTTDSSQVELQFEEVGGHLNKKSTIVIRPVSGGQFVERQEPAEPDDLCLYRIVFFGGHVIDYMNESLAGEIYVK